MAAITPEEAIDVIQGRFGAHGGRRALHAKGHFCRATFAPMSDAEKLTKASFVQLPSTICLARFSNGAGNPHVPDGDSDVRGLAVSFEQPDGSRTDIVCQSAPRFPVATPEEFIELVRLAERKPVNALRLPLFILQRPAARSGVRANAAALRPPASFATAPYFGVHAFRWVDAEGGARHVRYTWVPAAGEHRISSKEAKELGPDYLEQELRERLAAGPVVFTLEVQIAQEGDTIDDPSSQWPDDRRRVAVGELSITELIPDPEADGETVHVFDPTRVTDGIELSADPILHFRAAAYSESVKRRMASR